ncbi:MAG: BON domain-containing protein [Usitatibacter sp.]
MIWAYVKAGLLSDPAMKGADVSVNTDHGVVNLTGTVKSREQAAIAAIHAQRPDGVMRIESHLAVDAG